jgi:FAS-associated factor 2
MTDSEIDLGQLSSSQQEALNQYTQVTNQEFNEAIPLLRRSEWNVQVRNFVICFYPEILT